MRWKNERAEEKNEIWNHDSEKLYEAPATRSGGEMAQFFSVVAMSSSIECFELVESWGEKKIWLLVDI